MAAKFFYSRQMRKHPYRSQLRDRSRDHSASQPLVVRDPSTHHKRLFVEPPAIKLSRAQKQQLVWARDQQVHESFPRRTNEWIDHLTPIILAYVGGYSPELDADALCRWIVTRPHWQIDRSQSMLDIRKRVKTQSEPFDRQRRQSCLGSLLPSEASAVLSKITPQSSFPRHPHEVYRANIGPPPPTTQADIDISDLYGDEDCFAAEQDDDDIAYSY